MTLLYLVLGVIVFAYLGLPLMIRQKLTIHSRPDIQPATDRFLPEDVQEYFAEIAPKLSELGFERVACFTMDGTTPNVNPHVTLWINRASGQMAAGNVLIATQGDKPPKITKYVEFVSKLADGPSVTTNNSPQLGAFKKIPTLDSLSAARLHEPAHVHRLHLWRQGNLLDPRARRYLPEQGKELAAFADLYAESIHRQVGAGYLEQLPNDRALYRPTLAGAYLMTWAQLPPLKNMKRTAEDKRAEDQIRHAAAATTPRAPLRTAA